MVDPERWVTGRLLGGVANEYVEIEGCGGLAFAGGAPDRDRYRIAIWSGAEACTLWTRRSSDPTQRVPTRVVPGPGPVTQVNLALPRRDMAAFRDLPAGYGQQRSGWPLGALGVRLDDGLQVADPGEVVNGLILGDRILQVDGVPVETVQALRAELSRVRGAWTTVDVARFDEQRQVRAVVFLARPTADLVELELLYPWDVRPDARPPR
jgi:hypothetical protein